MKNHTTYHDILLCIMFYFRKEYTSEKNGLIIVKKILWNTIIIVNGCLESGPYLVSMWKDAFKKLPKDKKTDSILLLGLAGGNIPSILQKKYPHAFITILEWDEVMISIAKELKLFTHSSKIKIIHEDASLCLPLMKEQFDIIIIDMFTGSVPPQFISEKPFMDTISKVLKENGVVFINIYSHKTYLEIFNTYLSVIKIWDFQYNRLGLFEHKK